jgi:thiol-disulfide isomerase/thioredoxin
MKKLAVFLLPLLLTGAPLQAAPGQPAPAWDIEKWFNSKPLKVEDLRGKVVVIDFFQMVCRGCRKFSIPVIKGWEHRFSSEIAAGDLVILSIHTVFEVHQIQTNTRLEKFIRKIKMNHPVGVDRHRNNQWMPETMRRYKTKGTPEIAIIDKKGVIRFQKFGRFDVKAARDLIRKLLAE